MSEELRLIADSVIKGQANRVKTLTGVAVESGLAPDIILEEGLLKGMAVVSQRFRENIVFIPNVLNSSRAMHAGLRVLKPFLSAAKSRQLGRVVIGTVAGDLHDIGKNLVVMMLRGAGLEVIDIGIDVHPEEYANAIVEYQPDLLAMSALLTTTMGVMGETIRELENRKLRKKVKVMIGGGPVTRDYCRMIQADGYAPDATHAAQLAVQLVKENITQGPQPSDGV